MSTHPRAGSEADRLARVVLSCGVEPGDMTTSRLVADLGAQRALESELLFFGTVLLDGPVRF